jgi:hypothetical protein
MMRLAVRAVCSLTCREASLWTRNCKETLRKKQTELEEGTVGRKEGAGKRMKRRRRGMAEEEEE